MISWTMHAWLKSWSFCKLHHSSWIFWILAMFCRYKKYRTYCRKLPWLMNLAWVLMASRDECACSHTCVFIADKFIDPASTLMTFAIHSIWFIPSCVPGSRFRIWDPSSQCSNADEMFWVGTCYMWWWVTERLQKLIIPPIERMATPLPALLIILYFKRKMQILNF